MRACPAGSPVKAHAPMLSRFPTSGFGRRPERNIGAARDASGKESLARRNRHCCLAPTCDIISMRKRTAQGDRGQVDIGIIEARKVLCFRCELPIFRWSRRLVQIQPSTRRRTGVPRLRRTRDYLPCNEAESRQLPRDFAQGIGSKGSLFAGKADAGLPSRWSTAWRPKLRADSFRGGAGP